MITPAEIAREWMFTEDDPVRDFSPLFREPEAGKPMSKYAAGLMGVVSPNQFRRLHLTPPKVIPTPRGFRIDRPAVLFSHNHKPGRLNILTEKVSRDGGYRCLRRRWVHDPGIVQWSPPEMSLH